MSTLKPLKLYGHAGGPNPWKVAIVLEELGIPYETDYIDFSTIKQEPFIKVNPNGRVPAIEDPNTGLTLWESGAIIQYLIAEYDKDHKISYSSSPNKFLTDQWLFFQASGQGPYYGQFVWFSRYHPEKLPSAISRYAKEIFRVISVIEMHLSQTGQEWLVGDKCTYADLSFINWGTIVGMVQGAKANGEEALKDVEVDLAKYPKYQAWMDRLLAREKVAKAMKAKDDLTKK